MTCAKKHGKVILSAAVYGHLLYTAVQSYTDLHCMHAASRSACVCSAVPAPVHVE